MARFQQTTLICKRREDGEREVILVQTEEIPPVDCDDPHNILSRGRAESFLFIAREKPPILGYLLSSSWANKYTAAVRVVISGRWNTNPHGLRTGSITYHYGYLRTDNITNFRHKFMLKNSWVYNLWEEVTNPRYLTMTEGEGQLDGEEFCSMISVKELLKTSAMRYLAVAALWAYWQDNNVLIESRPSDLAVLDFNKQSIMNYDGKASEGKISKGAFATICKRAGVPKKIIPLALALRYTSF